MRLGRDGVAGLVGLAVSLLLLPHALGLPKLPIVPVGPGFYPTLVLAFMAAASAALIVQDVLAARRSRAAAAAAAPPEAPPRDYGAVLSALSIVILYVVVIPLLGFRIATALFVAAFQLVLERPRRLRQWLALAAVAVGTSAAAYLVFEQYLLVLLPRGTWTGW